jgi:hypothetical protein
MKLIAGMLILTSNILLLTSQLYAQAPDTLWTKTYGGIYEDEGYMVRETRDQGYIIVGETFSFGPGTPLHSNVYLIKTDIDGNIMWTKTYGDTADDWGYSVQETTDEGYIITGYTKSFGAGNADVYLIKTDAFGNTILTKTYGGSEDDIGYSVQETTDGYYIIAGSTKSFGAGDYDVYIIKADLDGDTVWTRTYGGTDKDCAYSIQEAVHDCYVITGVTASFGAGGDDFYFIKMKEVGDTLWTKAFGREENDMSYYVQETSDSGYVIAGTGNWGFIGYEMVYMKLDFDGDTVWRFCNGSLNDDCAYAVQETSQGGYVVIGNFSYDVYLIRTDPDGYAIWSDMYGGRYEECGFSVQETIDQGYIIAGRTNSFGAGLWDVYLIKTGPDPLGIEEKTSVKQTPMSLEVSPNPARKEFNIKYTLTKKTDLVAVLYDVTGRLIATFIDENQYAGIYCKVFDVSDLPQGIYFLRLNNGSLSDTKKITLIR